MVKILIVEDKQAAPHNYAEWLGTAGCEVKLSRPDASALAHIRIWQPDALLLNLTSWQGDGTESLSRIRAEAPRLPILVCTNGEITCNIKDALSTGPVRVFNKSRLTALDLAREIDQLLGQPRKNRFAA